MATEDRGFASMDSTRQREIASKGGRAAHKKGAAHQWTREEAQAAGRKGGLARHRKSQAAAQAQLDEPAPASIAAHDNDQLPPIVSSPLGGDEQTPSASVPSDGTPRSQH
jgi:general stress protein YciG